MGGVLSAFYAILCCSRREATAFTPRLRELALPVAVCHGRYMDNVYIAIAYAEDDQLVQATQVVHFIAAEGTGYSPSLLLNLEPEAPQRFLEMSIKCVGTAIVVTVVLQQRGRRLGQDWEQSAGATPLFVSYVSGTTQQARIRGTIRRMLECGHNVMPQEMARVITELQYEVALLGYRQPHVHAYVSSALRQ